jgi:hypothetical protein
MGNPYPSASETLAIENARGQLTHNLELTKSVVTAGESVLKTLLLINGGAVVAVLAFLGNVLTKELPKGVTLHVPHVTSGLLRFGVAVAFIGLGAVCRFLALWYARTPFTRAELTFTALAVAAGLASLVEFVCGCLWVVGAMR